MTVAPTTKKIASPTLPPIVLCRQSLLLRLREMIAGPAEGFPSYKLVLVYAPAGYGKTTLLADFARNTTIPCCWYFLDEIDADKYRFLEYLLASIRHQFPQFGHSLDALLASTKAALVEDTPGDRFALVVEALTATIEAEIHQRFAIFLCNYQEVNDNQAINELLNLLLRHLPANCTIVIESRTTPNLEFASLFVQRAMVGIGHNHLRFTAQEICELARLQGRELPDEQLAQQLAESFDGWITGILLGTRLGDIGLFQQPQPGYTEQQHLLSTNSQVLQVDRQYLFSYIVNEVFKHNPDVYTFLRQCSVLQEMEPELCNELLDITNAAEHLQYLKQNGLFVTSREEGEQVVYICTPVLRELLYEKLRAQCLQHFVTLHRRAADLLSARSQYGQAIYHAQEAGAEDVAANLIIAIYEQILSQGHVETLTRWINMLSPATIARFPKLRLINANLALLASDHARALSLLEELETSLTRTASDSDSDDVPLLKAECIILRSKALFQRGEYDQVQVLCRDVLEHLPVDEVKLRAETHTRLGICANLLGDFTTGITQLQKALQLWGRQTLGRQTAEIHSALASAYSLMGNFALAEYYITRAIACWEQLHDEWGKIYNIIRLGLIKQRQGAFIEAEDAFMQALKLARNTINFARGQAYALVNLGELYQEQGLYERSLAVTEDGLALARQVKDQYLINCSLCILAMTYLYMGDVATALVLTAEANIQSNQGDTPGYEQAIHELACGTILLYQQRYQEVYTRLSKMEAYLQKMGLKREQIYVIIRLAACLLEQGQTEKWIKRMEEITALLGQYNGYTHLVLTELRRLPKLYQAVETHPAMASLRALLHLEMSTPETLPMLPTKEPVADPPVVQQDVIGNVSTSVTEQPLIEIRALGEPTVHLQGEPVTRWRMARSMELFFFLLDAGRPVRKEQIMNALWTEVDEQTNQTIHSTIYYLRKALRVPCVVSQGSTYTLDLASHFGNNVWYDVTAFHQYQKNAHEALQAEDEVAAKEALLAQVELYRGDYVQPFYSDWCIFRRDELRREYLDARSQLAQITWRSEEFDQSALHWQHVLAVDNCMEQAHYGLIRCYMRQGKRGLALRQYQRCRDILQSELGVEPGSTMQSLYQRLTGSS